MGEDNNYCQSWDRMDVCEEEEGLIKMTLDHDIRRPGATITYGSGQRGRNAILISQSILFSDLQSIMIDNQIRPWTWATSRYKEFTKDNSFMRNRIVPVIYRLYLKCISLLRKKQIRNSKINFTQPISSISDPLWQPVFHSCLEKPMTRDKIFPKVTFFLPSFHNKNL